MEKYLHNGDLGTGILAIENNSFFGIKKTDNKPCYLTYHQYYNKLRYSDYPSEGLLVKNCDYRLILKRLDHFGKKYR